MHFRAITATLRFRTPLHIGTGKETQAVDDLVQRDTRGRLLIPGTALAGALRSIATRLAPRLDAQHRQCAALTGTSSPCSCLVCTLFGTVNPDNAQPPDEGQEKDSERTGHAATLLVYDAVLDQDPGCIVRDGVGIDRATGAAARSERAKFTQEMIPAGACFTMRIELDSRLWQGQECGTQQALLELLAAVLAEWKEQRGSLGGSVARGLGAFILTDIRYIEQDLNDIPVLMHFLEEGPSWDVPQANTTWLDGQLKSARKNIGEWEETNQEHGRKKSDSVARSWALIECTLAATGPFLTHDSTQAGRSGFDHAPLLSSYANIEQGARPVLPGSSVRGVLRSQAERIARTISTHNSCKDGANDLEKAKQHFFETCPACNPLASQTHNAVVSCNSLVKQWRSEQKQNTEQTNPVPDVEEHVCLTCRLFGSSWNGSRLRVEDAWLKENTRPQFKLLDFLAIDRFTGGGRDGAKFDALVLWKPKFRVRILLENPDPWELGLLLLVLRDIHDGMTSVGFGRSKGFGQCNIEDYQLTIGYLHDTDLHLLLPAHTEQMPAKSDDSGVYQTIRCGFFADAPWKNITNDWLKACTQKIATHQRASEFCLEEDSYFHDPVHRLYPVQALNKASEDKK